MDGGLGMRQRLIEGEGCIAEGITALVAIDPAWASVVEVAGPPRLRRRTPGFEGLARTIVSQQLSVASAEAIWTRLAALLDPVTPAGLLAASEEALAAAGLSGSKRRTLRTLAEATIEGRLAFEAHPERTPEAIHAELTAIKGVGPWTADIYLMFSLAHADAFAPGDLALQEAARLAFGLPARPAPEALRAMAEPWRPWRGVAAQLLWAYYHVVKRREGITG